MSEIDTRKIRVKLDTSVALPSNLAIASWRGNALDLEVGIYDADGVASISNITSVNVKVQASQLTNTTLMDKTVAAGAMDATLDATSWDDSTKQHATFSFTDAECNLPLTALKEEFWIVFTAILANSSTITLAAGSFTLHEDNDTTAGAPAENAGTAITLEEADARYAPLGSSGAGWELKTASFTAEPNGRYVIDAGAEITVTTAFATNGDTCEVYFRTGTQFIMSDLVLDNLFTAAGAIVTSTFDGDTTYTLKQYKDATAYGTAAQGSLAVTALQPSDVGTAAAAATGDFATAAQGTLAGTAVQPASTDTLTNKTIAAGSNTITGITNQIYHVREEQTSGTGAPASSAGLNIRVLNTEVTAGITGASLSSNQVTLPAGTYRVQAHSPVYRVQGHQAYLYNVTDSATEVKGRSGYDSSSATGGLSAVLGIFTIASSKVFELRHYCKVGVAGGLGIESSSGQGEVYADLMFTKLF